ncbi:MAG: acyl-CoA thioesterase [Gemmatimonadales bacterium]|nr:acyl-CoA thioesterase [Gemmatimonadales bacterium]
MDAYGHVNNAVLFRYFESARIAYLERCGLIESMEQDRVGAILHSTACRFHLPLYYPDTVEVGGRATGIAPDRFTMGYRVVSLTKQAVVAEGQGVIVSYDYARGRKTPLPEAIQQKIARLEGDAEAANEQEA